jgi:hypothetical protein
MRRAACGLAGLVVGLILLSRALAGGSSADDGRASGARRASQPATRPDTGHACESGFKAALREAIAAVAAGDARRFSQLAADEITVAKRRGDWNRSGKLTGPSLPPRGRDLELFLGGNYGVTWQQTEVDFSRRELRGREFSRILQQFQSFARVTEQHYGGGAFSVGIQDPIASKQGAPGFEGKLASDTYWFVYLVREGGQWRVCRLEWTQR